MAAQGQPRLVAQQPEGAPDNNGGNGGGGFDRRLRELELSMARLETTVVDMKEHVAVKNDVTGLKVWILAGVLGGIGVAAAIAATVVKAFF